MMGELVRREAEIAIAPLTINSQREQVVKSGEICNVHLDLGVSQSDCEAFGESFSGSVGGLVYESVSEFVSKSLSE